MSIRSLQARLICNENTLQDLWRTHRVFNEYLPATISMLFRMRRGECGETVHQQSRMAAFARALLNLEASRAYDVFIKGANGSPRNHSAKKLVSATDLEAAAAVDDFVAGFRPLADIIANLKELPNHIGRKVVTESCAIIRSHLALIVDWEERHAEWRTKKEQWEQNHKEYITILPRFHAFEQEAGGYAGKRRGRWDKYLNWLSINPELAAWRGGEAKINSISANALKGLESIPQYRRLCIQRKEFWKANPELAALDRLHNDYQRNFVRKWKIKRNADGFDHRPTFTLPHALRHPRWLTFNAPQGSPRGYRNLHLPNGLGQLGSLELRLLTGDRVEGAFPRTWTKVHFKGDSRFSDFRPIRQPGAAEKSPQKVAQIENNIYMFRDPQLRLDRVVKVSGARLMFRMRRNGTPKTAYLSFACHCENRPSSNKCKQLRWERTHEEDNGSKNPRRIAIPDGLIACAIDVGVRNLCFATLAEYRNGVPRVFRSRNIWIQNLEEGNGLPSHRAGGPSLTHIAAHKQELRKRRRLRGRPVPGEQSHIALQDHVTQMGKDRFNKGARAIINFALNTNGQIHSPSEQPYASADLLICENLSGLIPDAERQRGINRMLAEWNRGHLMDKLKELAADAGLKVCELNPYGTSQVCSRCGELGRRYSVRLVGTDRHPDISFGWVEKLFACRCGYRANADHNASINLHRKFAIGAVAVQSYTAFKRKNEKEQCDVISDLERNLLSELQMMHRVPAFD